MTMNFHMACRRHATVKNLAKALHDHLGVQDSGESIWNVIAGLGDSAYDPDSLEAAVNIQMPQAAVPHVQALSAVATAFAFACVVQYFGMAKKAAQQTGAPMASNTDIAKQAWNAFEQRRAIAHTLETHMGVNGNNGAGTEPSWEMAIEVAKLPDDEVRDVIKIAEMAGRMFQALQDGQTMTIDGQGETSSVTTGDDFEKLVATEITQLFDPALSDPAAIRLMEAQALQYQQTQTVPCTRGPLVIMVDESGSMHKQRTIWAKAATAALARVAHASGRMVVVVHYGTSAVVQKIAPGDHLGVLEMMRKFLGGGTDIAQALRVGLDSVGDLAAAGFAGADLIIVTDGDDGDFAGQNEALDAADAQGIDLYTVAVETTLDPQSPLQTRAKRVINVGSTGHQASVDYMSLLTDATRQFALPAKGSTGIDN
jgi:hypothetical protein